MEKKIEEVKSKKGFFARLLDKLDKKMEEQAKRGSCCCSGKDNKKDKSCCS